MIQIRYLVINIFYEYANYIAIISYKVIPDSVDQVIKDALAPELVWS